MHALLAGLVLFISRLLARARSSLRSLAPHLARKFPALPSSSGTFAPTSSPSTLSTPVSTSCQAQTSTCGQGLYYASAATFTTDRVCLPCTPGTFSAAPTPSLATTGASLACPAQSAVCPAGTYYAAPCSATTDRICKTCVVGTCAKEPSTSTFATNVLRACAPQVDTCVPGTYYSAPSTPLADRTCTACAPGTFSAESTPSPYVFGAVLPTSCAPQSPTCPAGTFYVAASTPTTDRVCAVCPVGGPISLSPSASTYTTPLASSCSGL